MGSNPTSGTKDPLFQRIASDAIASRAGLTGRTDSFVNSVLAVADDLDPSHHEQMVRAFRLFLLAHVATRLVITPLTDELTWMRVGSAGLDQPLPVLRQGHTLKGLGTP